VAQAGERRAVQASGRGPCGGHVVKHRGRVGGPDVAGGGDGGENSFRGRPGRGPGRGCAMDRCRWWWDG
jgi:hypothetical protein